jgi:acyl-CoA synthetase (AMP-forming)/AMP-acid ligase II
MHPHLPLTLEDILESNATRFGDRPAYVMDDGTALTHRALLERARKLASALHKTGMRHQDRVAVLAMNSLEITEVLHAGQVSSFIVGTVNFRLAPPEILYILTDIAPKTLVFEAQYLDVIDALRPRLDIDTYVCVGGSADWAMDYEAFVATGDADDMPVSPQEEDIYCVIYTSGTTGKPKGCIWGHREIRSLAERMSIEMRAGPAHRLMLVMPLFHIGAIAIGFGVQFRGGTVFVQRAFDPAAALATIAGEKITHLHFAPTMVQMLLEAPSAEGTDFSSVETVVYSAAPMPTPLLRRCIALMGKVFINLYGQSEVITSGLDRDLHRPDGSERERGWLVSVGHPYPSTLVRIVGEDGRDCGVNEPGEIVVRSTAMARGYWNNHPATLDTFRAGWCHSGDMGRIDEDGILYLVDRKKDMIISGGENIYSREVEDAILHHDAISECAVVGLPDAKWGEIVCAVVTVKAGAAAPTEEALIDHVKTLIASYKKPKKVLFAEELPKLPTGKINKVALREQVAG